MILIYYILLQDIALPPHLHVSLRSGYARSAWLWGSTCISHGAPRRWRCLRTVVGPLAHFAVTHKYPRGIFQKHPSPHITTQQQTENWGIKNIIKSGGNLLQETLIIPKKWAENSR